MTIRLRYHLALLPLFLGITVVNIGWYWLLEARELAWGVVEQAQARAITLAALWPVHRGDPAARALAMERFSQQAGGVSVSWFEPHQGSWSAQVLCQDPELRPVPAPDRDVVAELVARPAAARGVTFPEFHFDQVTAYAGVRDATGRVRAIVGIIEKDAIVRAEIDWLVATSAIFAGAVMLTGFVVTEALARRARREIAAVTAGAEALSRGEYDSTWPDSAVRELDDLSSTLRSIGRILADGVQRTRRRFLQAQQLPGEEEIAATYRRRAAAPPDHGADEAVDHALCQVGRGCPEDFWGWRREGPVWAAAIGRLQPGTEEMPALERLVRASAARGFILGQLVTRDPANLWAEFDAVFPCLCGESAVAASAERLAQLQTHGIDRQALPPLTAGVGVLGTLDADAMLTARAYAARFPDRPLAALARDLPALFAERHNGLILLFRLRPASR
jgi:hypothetical protein